MSHYIQKQTASSIGSVMSLTGNNAVAVHPNGASNINVIGSGSILVTGNAGLNTLTITADSTLADEFPTDSGTATPVLGVLNILGGDGINTVGATNNVTIHLDVPVTVPNGGTGAITLTDHGVLLGSGTGAISATSVGTNGQVLTGVTGADPIWAAPAGSSISITGDTGGAQVGDTFTFDGGTTGMAFDGLANTFTLSGTLIVGNGGTGATTLTGVLTGNGTSAFTASAVTQYNVLVGGASNAVGSVAPSATTGVPLVSQGAAANPAFGTAVVAGGGTGATTLTDHGVLLGSGTGAVSVTAVGATGEVLTGVTGSDPVWAAPASTGMTWTVITGTTQTLVANNGYFANHGTGVTFTTPASADVGDTYEVALMHASGIWTIGVATGQKLYIGNTSTTITTGTLVTTATGDWVEIVCRVADTDFQVNVKQGNITVS